MAYKSCPEELPWNRHTLLTPTTGLSSDSLLIFQLGLHYRSSLDIYVTSDVGHISRRIAEFVDHTNNPGRALRTDLHCIRIGNRHCSELGRLVLKMCIPAGVFQGLETRVDPSSFSQGPGLGLCTIWPRSRSWPWNPGGEVLVSASVSSICTGKVWILVLWPWRQVPGLGLECILPSSWFWDLGDKVLVSVLSPYYRGLGLGFETLAPNSRSWDLGDECLKVLSTTLDCSYGV